MIKEKRILSYFIGWLVLGLFVCFVGIKNTHALVIDSSYLGYSSNTNFGVSTGNYISGNSYILVDQSNALNYYVVDICSTLNYGFSISNVSNISGNVSLYKVFQNLGSCNTTNYDGTLSRIYFKINEWDDAGNGNFGVTFGSRFNNITTYYGDNRILNIYTTNEVDNTSEIINNQTNELNNSINNSTNTITGSITDSENNINQNIDDMESAIVDSNKETQDVIKDQFNSCRDSYNLLDLNNVINGGGNNITANIINSNSISFYMNTSGTSAYRQYMLYNPINTFIGKTIYSKFKVDNNYGRLYLGLFDSSYNRIGNLSSGSISIPQDTEATYLGIIFYPCYGNNCQNQTITFSEIMISEQNISFEPYGEEICSNKIDETNDALNNIGGALTDSSPTDMSGLGDSAGWLPPGPVDSIINLPLTFFLNLSQSLSSECRPVSLPLPFVNKNIELPCMNSIYDKIGITGIGGFFTWVGLICSAIILFNYLLDLYHWVDKTLTMRENTMPGYYDDKWGGGA